VKPQVIAAVRRPPPRQQKAQKTPIDEEDVFDLAPPPESKIATGTLIELIRQDGR
jgi:hypothetical protein